ncbi:hypothetical protein [Mycolicibacterium houstonense]|nr:hypothetical protein [Mycolicibacterium houstonense]
MEDEYFCPRCDHPKNEHDADGVCHALDMPVIGITGDCICDGGMKV